MEDGTAWASCWVVLVSVVNNTKCNELTPKTHATDSTDLFATDSAQALKNADTRTCTRTR